MECEKTFLWLTSGNEKDYGKNTTRYVLVYYKQSYRICPAVTVNVAFTTPPNPSVLHPPCPPPPCAPDALITTEVTPAGTVNVSIAPVYANKVMDEEYFEGGLVGAKLGLVEDGLNVGVGRHVGVAVVGFAVVGEYVGATEGTTVGFAVGAIVVGAKLGLVVSPRAPLPAKA